MKREDTLKLLEGFRLMDDDFMTVVFDRNIEATELVLNIILERDDLTVLEVTAQREYRSPITGGRSIELDIYAKDSEGKVYNIEVQRADAGADIHRARFHSSMLDSRMLLANQRFCEINDSYVIFITENDYMGKGLPIYHIERTILETGELFKDGSHIIYLNGSYRNDNDSIGRLVHDFRCTTASEMYYEPLQDAVRYFKETEGGRHHMCKAMEDYMRDYMKDTIVKERAEAALDNAYNNLNGVMSYMNITIEQAMEILNIAPADRLYLLEKFKKDSLA